MVAWELDLVRPRVHIRSTMVVASMKQWGLPGMLALVVLLLAHNDRFRDQDQETGELFLISEHCVF